MKLVKLGLEDGVVCHPTQTGIWVMEWPRIFSDHFGKSFFCSNALIALARSLCKCLLAVLITASEADAVAGFLDSWCQAV